MIILGKEDEGDEVLYKSLSADRRDKIDGAQNV